MLIYQSEQVGYVVAAVGGFAFDEVGFQAVLALKIPAEYARFGQIFGISYIYSIFWKFGLIRVPERIEEKLNNV